MSDKDYTTFTEEELIVRVRALTRSRLQNWVESGHVRPSRSADQEFYDQIDAARLELMCLMTDEFELSEDALSIFLRYVDQTHSLRQDLTRLLKIIQTQPEEVKKSIIASWTVE